VARLKTLAISDILQALELSGAEGWNQTGKDWKFLMEHPGNVCLAVEDNGKIVGTATAMIYENKVAWIGMVLVEKGHRGRGYSKLLLTEMLKRLKAIKTIKLDATPAGQPVYQKFGFRNERVINRMILESPLTNFPDLVNGNRTTRIQSSDIPEIIKYDAEIFGARRNQLIEYLVRENPENIWLVKQNSVLKGLALGRKGTRFFHIGPVLADSEKETRMLLSQMINMSPQMPVVADVFEDKKDLTNGLVNIGFKKQRQYIRMVLGENSPEIREKQYLICGPEFG
jgi:GNAT superfamily N-acetyltransferase